jgi:hypothetical protein
LLIRLKSIRAFLILPYGAPNQGLEVREPEEEVEEAEKECTDKMKTLLNHHLQCMISYLNREMQTTSENSILFLEKYVQTYFNDLKTKLVS